MPTRHDAPHAHVSCARQASRPARAALPTTDGPSSWTSACGHAPQGTSVPTEGHASPCESGPLESCPDWVDLPMVCPYTTPVRRGRTVQRGTVFKPGRSTSDLQSAS
eukprot:358088-Chlamydomonas_euryale.AAC.2